jgi:hypothetical protein
MTPAWPADFAWLRSVVRATLTMCGRWLSVLVLIAGVVLSIDVTPGLAEEGRQVLAARTPTPRPTRRPAATPTPAPTASPISELSPTAAPDETTGADEPVGAAKYEDFVPLAELTYPVPADQPADYPLETGHFFSQSAPGAKPGYGFSVVDAASVPLWREYQSWGGYAKLGYPVSRRFIRGDAIAQAFQNGMLLWNPAAGRASVVLLEQGETLPPDALEPEPPARIGTWAAHQPWSGWWWPANGRVGGPYLFDLNGPLAKYDNYVAGLGAGDPGTRQWEQTELRFDGLQWAGHCNGWAAAALLEAEPTQPIETQGMRFSVADQKGLLSAYHFADAAIWLHGGDSELSAVDFHNRLLEWLGNRRKGFVVTFRPAQNDEVWSYPVFGFDMVMSPDSLEPDVTNVTAHVWLSDNNVPADFVGMVPWKGGAQTYQYRIRGPREAPASGAWSGISVAGPFARPWTIWYPDPGTRNLDRTLSSPNLDYSTIRRILRGV